MCAAKEDAPKTPARKQVTSQNHHSVLPEWGLAVPSRFPQFTSVCTFPPCQYLEVVGDSEATNIQSLCSMMHK